MNALRTAPLADLRQGLHTSCSQIKAYVGCSQKFLYQYVLGVPPSHRPIALSFGSSVHAALEMFYQRLRDTGEKPPLAEIQSAFVDRLDVELADTSIPLRFDEGQDAGSIKDLGVAVLGAFWDQGFVPDQVLAVEQPFAVDLADPETGEVLDIPLIGAIDLVAVHQGQTVLVEHKTAARRFDQSRLAHDFQPTAYQYASRQIHLPNPRLVFQILLKSVKKPTVETIPVTRSRSSEVEMLSTFVQVLRGVEAGVFYRNRGWACGDCQLRYRCGG